MRLLVCTRNRGKLREMEALFGGTGCRLEALCDLDGAFEVEETGKSFEENAILKASLCSERFGRDCLADDSGLEVDFLGGRPGIYSARYAPTDGEKCRRLLEEMKDASERSARFVCCGCLYFRDTAVTELLKQAFGEREEVRFWQDPHIVTVRGILEGQIAREPRGDNGFGFDPVFRLPGDGRCLAELAENEKNALSHRGKAMRLIRELFFIVLIVWPRHMACEISVP